MKIKSEEPQHLYTSEQKIDWWGYGEWVEEPDVYVFNYKGYNCAVKRMYVQEGPNHIFGGYLLGYVEVPKEHPEYEKGFDDINIDCHGGLTYSEVMGNSHWIGFDCAHAGDYCPCTEKFKKESEVIQDFRRIFPIPEEFKQYSLFNPVYRNFQFCIDECKSIVDQLITINADKSLI